MQRGSTDPFRASSNLFRVPVTKAGASAAPVCGLGRVRRTHDCRRSPRNRAAHRRGRTGRGCDADAPADRPAWPHPGRALERGAHGGALARLDSLAAMLGEPASAALVASTRLRSPILVEHLAEAGPKIALAAITAARLSPREWLQIIPDLPVQARGFLRHRRDLGPEVDALLNRLGVTDFALPLPPGFEPVATPQAEVVALALPRPQALAPEGEAQSMPVRRRDRRDHRADRSLPPRARSTGGKPARGEQPARGDRADPPALRRRAAARPARDLRGGSGARCRRHGHARPIRRWPRRWSASGLSFPIRMHRAAAITATRRAARARLPIAGGRLELEGPGAAAGAWRIDAVPAFAADTGHFTGWHARLRRPPVPAPAAAANDDEQVRSADRLRQMLHELRTPINAVQGFAELIQQQMLGPTRTSTAALPPASPRMPRACSRVRGCRAPRPARNRSPSRG